MKLLHLCLVLLIGTVSACMPTSTLKQPDESHRIPINTTSPTFDERE